MHALLLAACPFVATPDVKWSAPTLYVEGQPYTAHVEIKTAEGGAVPAWMTDASAFTIDGQPIQERKKKDEIKLEGGKRTLDLDLDAVIRGHKAFKKHAFQLDFGPLDPDTGDKAITVRYGEPAEKLLNFMDDKKVPTADLSAYHVLLRTVQGPMEIEFWPDVAPGHVRNFLDLSHTGFYDGTAFFRVMPGFMIQGGDPSTKSEQKATWGTGRGPRMLTHEFSDRKHVRGVLSMARGGDVDSASSQFFVMDATYPSLDGQYSAFGKLVEGFEALAKIVNAPGKPGPMGDGSIQPNEPQRIVRAVVVKIVSEKPAEKASEKPPKK